MYTYTHKHACVHAQTYTHTCVHTNTSTVKRRCNNVMKNNVDQKMAKGRVERGEEG